MNTEEWSDLLAKPYHALFNRRRVLAYRAKVSQEVDPMDWAFKVARGLRIQEEMRLRFLKKDGSPDQGPRSSEFTPAVNGGRMYPVNIPEERSDVRWYGFESHVASQQR